MNPTELLKAAQRLAPSRLARVRILKSGALATIVPPGSEGKFLVFVEGAMVAGIARASREGWEGVEGRLTALFFPL